MRNPSTPAFARCLPLAVLVLSAAVAGCASLPRIDPTGEQILTWTPQPTPVVGAPGVGVPAVAAPGLTLTPMRIVAPVGSEVLMVAGVHGLGQPNLAGQRVEWMLSPGSVGHFLAVGESEQPRFLRFSTPPQKVSNDYAVSETQSTARIITRGTVDPGDDVSVLPGQAWVTVASPVEGSSYVTAFAPDVQGVLSNRQSGVIHWVDVRWTAPSSATVPVGGKHSLVTTVTRASSGAPVAGYKVWYELAGGVEAGFGPAAAGGVELTTNEQGVASAELAARDATAGGTQVSVQLIRPAGAVVGANEPLVLGNATITVTWAAAAAVQPALPPGAAAPGAISPSTPSQATGPADGSSVPAGTGLELRVVSPVQPVAVGGQATFEIHITNRTSSTLRNVVVLDRFEEGLQHSAAAKSIQRKEGDLAPNDTRSFGLTFTVRAPGKQCHTVEVSADGTLLATAEGCVTATGAAEAPEDQASIDVRKSGPLQMKVGETALFKLEITNTGKRPIDRLQVADSWRGGLAVVAATSGNQRTGENEITWQYDKPLAPGGRALFEVQYKATSPMTNNCTTATVSGDGLSATDEHCVEIIGEPNANATAKDTLTVLVSDSTDPAPVGTPYNYRIVVKNEGAALQRNIVLVVEAPESLEVETMVGPVKQLMTGRVIRFEPVLSLKPQESLSYELRVKGTRAGRAVIRASATSQSVTSPIVAEHETQLQSGPPG
ncbi:MAG: hypothetical protein WD894_09995 [Pirellulales bacterium]